jgi:GNAT superfamily N-acetyltransferase
MEYIRITDQNRYLTNAFIEKHWFSTTMVIRGKTVDMTKVDGIAAINLDEIAGLLTYIIRDGTCEITSLNSLYKGRGIATELIEKLKRLAKAAGCNRIIVVTTNDNVDAIRFYQKRGFDMIRLYHNALDISRKIKPEIPSVGQDGIPIKHEIEFELVLSK